MKVSARMPTSHGSICQNVATAHTGGLPSNRSMNANAFDAMTMSACRPIASGLWNRSAKPRRRLSISTMGRSSDRRAGGARGRVEHIDDVGWLRRREARPARQAEPHVEHMLGHRATTDGAAAERRLQVHRLPERPRLDVARLELEADVLARRAELLRRDEHARQPAVAGAVRRFGHERDARRGERAAVDGVDLAAPRELRGQRLQLRAADRGEQVADAVVEADVVVLIVRGWLARLRREMARALDDVAAVRHEHAAAARRDDLVAVERESRALAERAGAAAAAGRAERFRGVLDHRHAVARADVEDAR